MRVLNGSTVFLVVVVSALVGCGGKEGAVQPVPPAPSMSEVLSNWGYEHRVSLACRETPLAEVAAEIARQSGMGVTIHVFQEDREKAASTPVTLTLKEAPFWQAIAEVSKASGVGFIVKSGIEFSGDLPPLVDWRLIGPVLVGLVKSQEGKGDATSTTVGPYGRQFDVSSAKGRELRLRFTGYYDRFTDESAPMIVPTGPNGKDLGDPIAATAGEMGLYDGEVLFHLPEAIAAKAAGFRGYVDAQVVYDVKTLDLPATEGRELDQDRLHAKVTGIKVDGDKTEVHYEITWDTGLRGKDAERLAEIVEGKVPMDEAMKWIKEKTIITYAAVEVCLLDAGGKHVPSHARYTTNAVHLISGTYTFKGRIAGEMTLRVKIGRRLSGRVSFSFPDALK